ncbi:hypothetical protein DRH27_06085 [Candidatus Falkowbacteria bacterium]|nr:MAG: hypothetical protein DRH27_06085 [Candidatus Falkowbacteria bacterium]
MACKHENTLVQPGSVEKYGDEIKIDLKTGKLFCRDCDIELPFEDIEFYDRDKMSVGIPTKLVDE